MDLKDKKYVMIIDADLPQGIIANTTAILGITIGCKMPDIVGTDVADKEGNIHLGITAFPIPVLKGSEVSIKELRQRLYSPDYSDLTVVDFSDLAQGCNVYSEFTEKIAATDEAELRYYGIAICGDKRKVNKLTGSMPLLR